MSKLAQHPSFLFRTVKATDSGVFKRSVSGFPGDDWYLNAFLAMTLAMNAHDDAERLRQEEIDPCQLRSTQISGMLRGMQTILSYRHRVVTASDVTCIRNLIAEHPGSSRRPPKARQQPDIFCFTFGMGFGH